MEGNVNVRVGEKVLAKLDFNRIRQRLADQCHLELARAKAMALVPSADLQEVRSRLRETDEAQHLLRFNPLFSIRGTKEIHSFLERCARGGTLLGEELADIKDTMRTARQVRKSLTESAVGQGRGAREVDLFSLRRIAETIVPLPQLEAEIARCITDDGQVADRASEELTRLRRAVTTTQQRIKANLDGVLRSAQYQKMLQDHVITTRAERYVVPIKQEYASAFPGIVHDQSASGATLFIEPMAVVQLGNSLRETILREIQEVQRILQSLSQKVADQAETLFASYEALIAIDFILAKARLGAEMNAGAPLVVNKREVSLVAARHPLLAGGVVPLTVELGQEYNLMIITGPNTGGKTVALKTVALMVIMTQCGLHIPAEENSRIGIFGSLFIDIGDEQSVEQSLSTFSGHMANIIEILNEADDRSLVLFDEIGAGTDPAEGAALAMAILGELLRRGCRGIATTHYGALKTFAYDTPGVENASVEFDAETLRPTYRLMIGIPGRSNAFAIAERLGLSEMVLEKARGFLSERQMQMASLLENLEETQRAIEAERAQLQAEREAGTLKLADLDRERQVLREKNEEILQKARDEALNLVQGARQESERIIKEIKEAQKKERREQDQAMEKARQGVKRLSDSIYSAGGKRKAKATLRCEQIVPGQEVYLPNLREKGHILTKPDKNGEVVVQTAILKITVPLAEIRLIDETRSAEHMEKTLRAGLRSGVGIDKATTLRSEIDLRGRLVEEGLEMLDKYLDDAVLTGINQVSVIHGKGTGALRTGVHQFLRQHPHVTSFRLGEYGEGDSGVTIIDLK